MLLTACIVLGCTTVLATFGMIWFSRALDDANFIILSMCRANEEKEKEKEKDKNKLEINF